MIKPSKLNKGDRVAIVSLSSGILGEKALVFMLGKSGSGKSTLLNLIGGLDKYDSGDILIKGKSKNSNI